MIKYTELSSTNRQNLREILPLAKPFTVLIEPSSLCNFRCIQCFQSIKTESYFTRNLMNMPMERFRRVIGQLHQWPGPKLKVLKLNLYGEPLVSPDFPEMLELAKQANITERIETTTNASLLTPEVAESMIKNGLDYLRVSIYATEQDRHQRVTGSTLNIRRIRDNLVYLLKPSGVRMSSDLLSVARCWISSTMRTNAFYLSLATLPTRFIWINPIAGSKWRIMISSRISMRKMLGLSKPIYR